MARDNNGVPAKVYSNIGVGSINRGNGQGGVKQDFNDAYAKPQTRDMESHHGPKGSSGTTKFNGGIGDMAGGARVDPFKDAH